ncbi:MAG: hypothetical protein LBC33_01690 [Mycoplasmataceae bacterium]|nr:hypothetical protein [Mycoplasmataceae bacterium]
MIATNKSVNLQPNVAPHIVRRFYFYNHFLVALWLISLIGLSINVNLIYCWYGLMIIPCSYLYIFLHLTLTNLIFHFHAHKQRFKNFFRWFFFSVYRLVIFIPLIVILIIFSGTIDRWCLIILFVYPLTFILVRAIVAMTIPKQD